MNRIIFTTGILLISVSLGFGQVAEKQEELVTIEKLGVKIKTDAKPDIYVDGEKFNFNVELLDKDMIASVNVVKGDQALKEYNSPNGVILITTKLKADQSGTKIRIRGTGSIEGDNAPLVIVDGKVKEQAYLKEISPEDIESINVLKGEKAEKYDAPNGVILITTKGAKKKN